jgi:hypothetical protein
MKLHKNAVQRVQNTVNRIIHITKTPTRYKPHTYIQPHITKQVKTTTVQVKTITVQYILKWNSQNITKYKVEITLK